MARKFIGYAVFIALILGAIWASVGDQPSGPISIAMKEAREAIKGAVEQEKLENERQLCRKMTACNKYTQVRFDCATAADFERCIQIRMGDDVGYPAICTGGNKGGPALPLDPNTPNAFTCFFLR